MPDRDGPLVRRSIDFDALEVLIIQVLALADGMPITRHKIDNCMIGRYQRQADRYSLLLELDYLVSRRR